MTRLPRLWDSIELLIAGLLALFGTAIVLYATFLRYAFRSSPSWAIEIVIYMFIWATFVLASTLVREGGHVGADFVVGALALRVRRGIEAVTAVLALGFELAVLWLGFWHTLDAYEFGARSTTALRFPLWIAYAAVPVGALLLSLRLVQRLYLLARRPDEVALTHGDARA